MTVTVADITNRALQLIGTRTTVTTAELAASSTNEAIQSNLVYTAIRDWCLGSMNWNFARKTVAASPSKTVIPTAPWAATSPSPPWKYEYAMPSDVLRVQYITNSDLNSGSTAFLGEPKRFQVAADTLAAVEQKVILCNEISSIIIVYTAVITDPTEWPWLFERFMVSALAASLSMTLTGDKELFKELNAMMNNYFDIAFQSNLAEGLYFADTGPEWIQALGVNYPFRRQDGREPQAKDKPNDNRR